VSSTNGIIINITAPGGVADAVTLRNIQINGIGNGIDGVRVLNNTTVILDHVNIFGFATAAVSAEGTSKVSVNDGSFFNNPGIAMHALNSAILSVESSQINGNNIAVQADLGSTINLTNNAVYNNKTGFACGTGGTLGSAGNKRKANNVGGVVPTCTPTVAVTLQ